MKPKQPPHRRRKRNKAIVTAEVESHDVIPFAPSESWLVVDAICKLAEGSGWPGEQAFAAAMFLRIHGVSVAQAAQMFADCQRRVQ
jgi:hypothetical protein